MDSVRWFPFAVLEWRGRHPQPLPPRVSPTTAYNHPTPRQRLAVLDGHWLSASKEPDLVLQRAHIGHLPAGGGGCKAP